MLKIKSIYFELAIYQNKDFIMSHLKSLYDYVYEEKRINQIYKEVISENVGLLVISTDKTNLKKVEDMIKSVRLLSQDVFITVIVTEALTKIEESLISISENKKTRILVDFDEIKRTVREALFEYTIREDLNTTGDKVSESYVDKINWMLKIKKYNRFKKSVQQNLIKLEKLEVDETHTEKKHKNSEDFMKEITSRFGEEGYTNNLIWLLELLDNLNFASAEVIIFENEVHEVIRAFEYISKIFIELKYFDKLSSVIHEIKNLIEKHLESKNVEITMFLSLMTKNIVIDLEELVLNIFIRGNIKDINYLDDSIIGVYYQTLELLEDLK